MTSAGTAVRRLALLAGCLWVILGTGSPIGAARTTPQGPLPTLTAPVNDIANVVDATSAAELDRLITVLQATTGDVVVVATIDTFAPYATIEEYATRLFEQAGIGTRKADSGVLMLVAVRDRRVRIEVGYGIEEFITDGFAGDTIRTQMLPAFREGGYGPGLVAGVTRVIMRIAQGRSVTLPNVAVAPRATSQRQADGGLSPGTLVVMVLLFLLIGRFGGFGGLAGVLLQNRRGRRSTWSGWHGGSGGFGGGFGGGGGGGFGGFGGGRSGGGGASGGW